MKTFLVILFTLGLVGCTGDSPKVITADLLSSAMSTAITTTLDCSEKDVVAADVKEQVYKWFQLKGDKGIVQDLCKSAIADVLPMLLGTTMDVIKPEWKCTVTKLDNAADVLATLACGSIKI